MGPLDRQPPRARHQSLRQRLEVGEQLVQMLDRMKRKDDIEETVGVRYALGRMVRAAARCLTLSPGVIADGAAEMTPAEVEHLATTVHGTTPPVGLDLPGCRQEYSLAR
jgi:hypothetical protein